MRRVSNKQAISPKQLKHFAAAAVAVTALLALFASGEDWGAQAQISAVETKNQVLETEAQKLGTKKIGMSLGAQAQAASFDDTPAPAAPGGASAPAPNMVSAPPQQALQSYPGSTEGAIDRSKMPTRPGQSVTMKGVIPPGKQGRKTPKSQAAPVDAEQTAKINAVSRQRGGSTDQGD